jgi:hypothetical protein
VPGPPSIIWIGPEGEERRAAHHRRSGRRRVPATLDPDQEPRLMLTVTLGPLTMALNHLLMLAALGIACLVGWRVAKRAVANPEAVLFNLFLLGLLCARVGFVWPTGRCTERPAANHRHP